MNLFCKMNLFRQRKLDRATPRRRESPAPFVSPRASNGGGDGCTSSGANADFVGGGAGAGQSGANRARGAGLPSPRSPQSWSGGARRLCDAIQCELNNVRIGTDG